MVSEYAFNTADCCVRAISCNDEVLLRSVLKLYTLKLSCMAGEGPKYSRLTLWRVSRRARRIHLGFYERFYDDVSMPASLRW